MRPHVGVNFSRVAWSASATCIAGAALRFCAGLRFVLQSVHYFDERRTGAASVDSGAGNVGLRKSQSDVLSSARTALRFFACSFLALQFTLGLGTVGGLDALVEAGELFADRLASWFRRFASGMAVSRLANRFALGAALLLALIFRATNSADWLFAVHGAFGTSGFLALHLAFRSLTHRVTNRGASRVIALPLAQRVTLLCEGYSGEEKDSEAKQRTGHRRS